MIDTRRCGASSRDRERGAVTRRRAGLLVSALPLAISIASADAHAAEPVDPRVPWALRPEPATPRAVDHPETPGVLYLAVDGVELRPFCGAAQNANGALNCTPLVDEIVEFPPYGSATERAALLQTLSTLYDPYDLVLSLDRPPDWLPYTMAVIGGASSLVGAGDGVCGLANVACDGAKRNHVSLTFAETCPGAVAVVAAQETAHNWGLEHVTAPTDVMYPFVAIGAPTFHDACLPVSNQTGSPITTCPYVHRAYCPEGDGEQQNGHAELLAAFGPRAEDDVAPRILETTPQDGDVWTTADEFPITARFEEDSGYLAVRWSWIEGAPAQLDVGDDGVFTSCTNAVCELEYALWKDTRAPYDFVVFNHPPAGEYEMLVEAMDARGNYSARSLRFTVVESDTPSATGTPGDGTGDVETGPAWTANADASGGGDGDAGTDTDGAADGDDGCACRGGGRPRDVLWLALALLTVTRRRRGAR